MSSTLWLLTHLLLYVVTGAPGLCRFSVSGTIERRLLVGLLEPSLEPVGGYPAVSSLLHVCLRSRGTILLAGIILFTGEHLARGELGKERRLITMFEPFVVRVASCALMSRSGM